MKNQKGVSLITLVITIIVVIILAAIAIRGASDIPGQAQFSGFANSMGEIQDAVAKAMLKAQGDEATRIDGATQRSDAQLYNYVARGGRELWSTYTSGDAHWLTAADAETIPCTIINKKYAEDSILMELPVQKVETYYGTNQEVTYYVTPKGNVFCWPPYTYDNKSYVAENVTVKSGDAELAGKDATKTGDYVIEFANGEKVAVKVAASGLTETTAEKNLSSVINEKVDGVIVGVWYNETDATTAVPADRGVAHGINYDSYLNTATVTP